MQKPERKGKLKVGEMAPDFELLAQEGRKVSLHEFAGSKNVVLFFYPKDFTRGCTFETKYFGESYDEIRKLNAEVLGISNDSVESHTQFAAKCGVSFPMLADDGGKVRELYSVEKALGFIPGRTTFVIDKHGIVRNIFSSQTDMKAHVTEAMAVLKTLPND